MTATDKGQDKQKPAGMGLDSLGDLSGLLNAPEASVSNGGPLMLDMMLIDEDPKQPRKENNPGFKTELLEELAATIRLRGVKTPISVRENPDSPGRYLINHGARRFRASKMAGKSTIPGWIDNNYKRSDQVVENLHREGNTARELADFIGSELAAGKKKAEIAREMGKSAAFVTQHATLLDLPDPIAEAFNFGRVNDVTVINELVMLYKKSPDEISEWLEDESQEITRGSVKLLREFLDDKRQQEDDESLAEQALREARERTGVDDCDINASEEGEGEGEEAPPTKLKEEDPTRLKKAIIQVQHNGRPARLLLNKRPSATGFAWLKYDDDGEEFEDDLAKVTLVALIEA